MTYCQNGIIHFCHNCYNLFANRSLIVESINPLQQHLPYLINLGLAFLILDVDPWIANPRRLEDCVAGACLAWFSEIVLADFHQLDKPHVGRLAAHLLKNFFGRRHGAMVSILAPQLNRSGVRCS